MPLDLQVVRAPTQLDQGPGDDIDETPGELAKRCGIAFTAELPGDARGHLRDTSEPPYGVVAGGDLWPT
ncbi:hypothetical protein D9M73_267770 [compost metagenome]